MSAWQLPDHWVMWLVVALALYAWIPEGAH